MKVWITKYALTKGIFEAETVNHSTDNTVNVHYMGELSYCIHWFCRPDWCETHERAVARAEEMRAKKIESLKKQITKLENMKFE